MLLDIARSRRLVFVGGKGGTGKTSVSSGMAAARAEDGGRVLLVSTDPAHNLGDIWGQSLGDRPCRALTCERGHVDAIEVNPQTTIDEHFATVEDMMRRMLPERTHGAAHDHLALARKAPGSHESAVLERIATISQDARGDYDLVIFDTAPSGHTLHLLSLPQKLTGWAESLLANRDRSESFAAAARHLVSPKDETPTADKDLRRTLLARRDRFALLRANIADPATTGFLVVTLAEKLPVAETLSLVRELDTLGVDLAGLVVNRRSPVDEGAFLSARREVEESYISELERALAPVEIAQLPLLPGELVGTERLREFAQLLATV
jgi:arsenite-transporting ATPase